MTLKRETSASFPSKLILINLVHTPRGSNFYLAQGLKRLVQMRLAPSVTALVSAKTYHFYLVLWRIIWWRLKISFYHPDQGWNNVVFTI